MISRREFIKTGVTFFGSLTFGGCLKQDIFRKKFKELREEEKKAFLRRLEEGYEKKYGISINVDDSPALEDVVFGYGLDLSRCIGCRRCVYACMKENNNSRDIPIQWIRVLRWH